MGQACPKGGSAFRDNVDHASAAATKRGGGFGSIDDREVGGG